MAVAEDTTGALQKVTWTWTTAADGSYSAATTNQYNGAIQQLITIPTDGPTDNYDIVITDSGSVDVLAGQGADRDTTNTEYKFASAGLGFVKSSKLTLTIANGGNAKSGKAILYILDLDKGMN